MMVYTSGTTGKPKGTVHTHCGFMTKIALDFGLVLDVQPSDRLLWMSDMGWLIGPILAVAVPLLGATLVLAEGVPDCPEPGRLGGWCRTGAWPSSASCRPSCGR